MIETLLETTDKEVIISKKEFKRKNIDIKIGRHYKVYGMWMALFKVINNNCVFKVCKRKKDAPTWIEWSDKEN